MSLSTQPYKGARDFYPEDMRIRSAVFANWRSICERFGYEEYDAPIIEPVDIFAAKSGDELVNEQAYNFVDRGGREVMLRPEMTPSVSRLVAGRRQELPLPIRWFSIPNCWRYERPQKGRGREFYQLNVDLFGVSGSEAEVEILQIADAIMQSFKAKRDMYQIKVNSRVFMNWLLGEYLGLNEVEQKTIARLIDRMHKIEGTEFAGLIEASIAPSLREQGVAQKLLDILRAPGLEALPDDLKNQPAMQNLQAVVSAVQGFGITNVSFDITLIRGLDYYTDFVFEVFDMSPDNNRSMFGGGRYDSLVGMFGVEGIPTIGFGMGDMVLMEFLSGHGLVPETRVATEVTVIPIGETLPAAQNIAAELREMGVNTSLDITARKTDKMLKSAIKSGVPYVLFVGEQEVESEQYKLKNLVTGTEEAHSVQRIVSIVKDHRKQTA